MHRLMNVIYVNNVYVTVRDAAQMDNAVGDITSILRERHHLNPARKRISASRTRWTSCVRSRKHPRPLPCSWADCSGIASCRWGWHLGNHAHLNQGAHHGNWPSPSPWRAKEGYSAPVPIEALVLSIVGGLLGAVIGVFASLIIGWTSELPTSVSILSVLIAFHFLRGNWLVLRHLSGQESR